MDKGLNSNYKNKYNFNFFNKNYKKPILISLLIIIVLATIVYFVFFNKINAEPNLDMVSGTEYISGEEGQVIVRLQNTNNQPINDANCLLSLLYPDKSFFLIDVPMEPTTVPGNYYHSFTTPNREGVYEEHIVCEVGEDDDKKKLRVSYSFHVSTGLNLIAEVSKSQREQYQDLVERVNNLDKNMDKKFNYVNSQVNNVQKRIDENVMQEIDTVKSSVDDVNHSINSQMDGIESRLNQTMMQNFSQLYSKFKESYNAMSNIFNTE